MMHIRSWAMALLVFYTHFPGDILCEAPSFNFVEIVIPKDKECGLENGIDHWSVTGTLTVPDISDLAPTVSIVVGAAELIVCTIKIDECSPGSDPCDCTNRDNSSGSDVFSLSVRLPASAPMSGRTLKAQYFGKLLPSNIAHRDIGNLPFMYLPANATYATDGAAPTPLKPSQTVETQKASVKLSLCVSNLLENTMQIDNKEEAKTGDCVNKVFAVPKKVVFGYIESERCERKDTFTINLKKKQKAVGTTKKPKKPRTSANNRIRPNWLVIAASTLAVAVTVALA